jgi:hypothetical protein
MGSRGALILVASALVASVPACSAPGPSEPSPKDKALAEYDRSRHALAAYVDACSAEVEKTGSCSAPLPDETAGGAKPQGLLQSGADLVTGAGQRLLAKLPSMCEALAPFARLQHPYFFLGASVQGGEAAVLQLGADEVYDMWNYQSAVFSYRGIGIETLVGAEGSAYMGYGFGNMSGVIDAWSGRFCQASGSFGLKGLPFAGIGAGGALFGSPSLDIIGASVGVSGYVGWSTPVVSGAIFAADWTPWNDMTRRLQGGMGSNELKNDGLGHDFVQYAGALSLAGALYFRAPPVVNAALMGQVLGIAALRKTGLTIEQACPDEVANAPTPSIAIKVGGLCGGIGNPIASSP